MRIAVRNSLIMSGTEYPLFSILASKECA